ncbi:MAG: Asp-tRNA(Asn) amidotransferase subunit GatC [Candidatus Altiarchaeota archaeon]|nr:Asp-tRNA(Asn) amidotransferase subunit GatC [Candidatus Altiarchaeota archaeon]
MVDAEKVREEGVKLLEDFSKKLENIPETDETHYVVDLKNVWRKDEKPKRCEGFKKKLSILAPRFEDGYVIAEKSD